MAKLKLSKRFVNNISSRETMGQAKPIADSSPADSNGSGAAKHATDPMLGSQPRSSRKATMAKNPTERAPSADSQPTKVTSSPKAGASAEIDSVRVLGRMLDDIQRTRIAIGNQIGAMERERGDALPHLHVIMQQAEQLEHITELELKRAWRQHPLAPWAKEIKGAGEVLVARLISIIDGDRVDKQTGEVRPGPLHAPNVAKLWAYCGHGDPERAGSVPKGATQEELFKRGNPEAKKRAYLLAAQFRRTPGSYYREVYDEARAKYADRVHSAPCKRCGPSGKPAAVGTPWSLGHQDGAALRKVAKEFLKDLWCAAHDWHETQGESGAHHEI